MAKRSTPSDLPTKSWDRIYAGPKNLRQDYESLKQHLSRSEASLSARERAEATIQLAMCENLMGSGPGWSEAQRLIGECRDHIMEYGSDRERAFLLHITGMGHFLQADYAEALSFSTKALYLFRQQQMPFYIMDNAICCGMLCGIMNMVEEGMEYFAQAEAAALQMEDEKDIITYISNIEDNRMQHHDPVLGIRLNKELLARIKSVYGEEPTSLLVSAHMRFAHLYITMGRMEEADQHADLGIAEAARFQDMPNAPILLYHLYSAKATVAAALKNEAALKEYITQATILGSAHGIFVTIELSMIQFRFYLDSGDMQRATQYLGTITEVLPPGDRGRHYLSLLEARRDYHRAAGDATAELAAFQQIHDYKMKAQQDAVANRVRYMTTIYELELKEKALEQQRAELNRKTEELNMATYYLQQRNTLLNDLREDLAGGLTSAQNTQQALRKITTTIDRAFAKEEDEKLRIREKFDEAQQAYITRLHQAYPDLSPTELRLCALLRSGFSSKEICTLLSTSLRNVENHRTRIRRKLQLKKEDNLNLRLAGIA